MIINFLNNFFSGKLSKRLSISFFPVLIFLLFSYGFIWQNKQNTPVKKEIKNTESTPLKITGKNEKEEISEEHENSSIDTVKIGAYVFSVYDLDFPGNKINVDFYLWYNAKKDSLSLLDNLEVINSTELSKSYETSEVRGDIFYKSVKIKAIIKQEWNVTDFPFDKQKISVMIEDFDKDNTSLVFIADTAASKIDKDVRLEGWKIKDFNIKIDNHEYETNYGDPDILLTDYSSYSRATISFTIEREGKGLFFKLFVGLFISVLISLLTFFINPLDLDPRFGLSVGAIFAAIASQYVITSSLPQNAGLTLVDILHDISFIYIFLCILISTISLHYVKAGKIKEHKKLDRISFAVFSLSYVILMIYFIGRAI